MALAVTRIRMDIEQIKVTDNETVDTLKMLLLINYDITEIKITREALTRTYCVNKLYGDTFSLTF